MFKLRFHTLGSCKIVKRSSDLFTILIFLPLLDSISSILILACKLFLGLSIKMPPLEVGPCYVEAEWTGPRIFSYRCQKFECLIWLLIYKVPSTHAFYGLFHLRWVPLIKCGNQPPCFKSIIGTLHQQFLKSIPIFIQSFFFFMIQNNNVLR